jgi:hypothetical protein
MSPQQDQLLFDDFKARHFWLLTPDTDSLRLAPLEASPADGSATYSKAAQTFEENGLERTRAAARP